MARDMLSTRVRYIIPVLCLWSSQTNDIIHEIKPFSDVICMYGRCQRGENHQMKSIWNESPV